MLQEHNADYIVERVLVDGQQGAICLTSTFKVVGFEKKICVVLFLDEYTIGFAILQWCALR